MGFVLDSIVSMAIYFLELYDKMTARQALAVVLDKTTTDYIKQLERENQELKKQVEDLEDQNEELTHIINWTCLILPFSDQLTPSQEQVRFDLCDVCNSIGAKLLSAQGCDEFVHDPLFRIKIDELESDNFD